MSPRTQAAWTGSAALGIALLLFAAHPWLLDRAEYALLDARFQLRGPSATESPVAIVAIDAESLDAFGRWPWRRSLVADLIDRLVEAEAAVIGLDLVFSEAETPRDLSALRLARRVLSQQPGSDPTASGEIATLDRVLERTDTDARLAEAIANSGRTVTGYFFRTAIDEADPAAELTARLPEIRRSQVSVAKVPQDGQAPILTCTGLETNVPAIQRAGRRSGFLSAVSDSDGVTRRAALVARCDDSHYVSLALALYELHTKKRTMLLGDEHGLRQIRVGDRSFPTDEGGKILINYRGPAGTFREVSAADVLRGRLAPGELAGTIALVGPTEVGLGDARTTPFEAVFPGVEIHANILDNLIAGDVIRRDDAWVTAELGLIVLIGLVLIVVIPRTSGVLVSFAFAGTLAVALLALGAYAFVRHDAWLNLIYPLVAIGLVYLAVELPRSLAAESRSRRVRKMFATYVPPSVVRQLADDEEELRLGGETRTLSILFSDVRDFTTLSEQLGAEHTIRLMNVYLGAMTKIVFDTSGTLDKYIGDAVMAFWGAPVSFPDHADRACRAALDMQRELKTFARDHPDVRGAEHVRAGIGLHTDSVMVGNIGSDLRFDYTLIGDGVNLCSRLEGLCKTYGIEILASREMVSELREPISTREIDDIRVKGRQASSVIYEVLGDGPAGRSDLEWLEAHAEGLGHYRAGRWSEARARLEEVIAIRGGDGPSAALLDRMRALDDAPPDDWTGVWSFETK